MSTSLREKDATVEVVTRFCQTGQGRGVLRRWSLATTERGAAPPEGGGSTALFWNLWTVFPDLGHIFPMPDRKRAGEQDIPTGLAGVSEGRIPAHASS